MEPTVHAGQKTTIFEAKFLSQRSFRSPGHVLAFVENGTARITEEKETKVDVGNFDIPRRDLTTPDILEQQLAKYAISLVVQHQVTLSFLF